MRVGLTLCGSLDGRSGGFRYDRRLVEELRAAGDTVEVIELPWRAYGRGLLDNADPRLRDRLDVDVDVMLQDELAHPSLLVANRSLSYPVVGVVHHLRADERRPLSPFYRAVERRYLDTVDGAVCNSSATRASVTALGVDPDATVLAPPAGDRFDPDVTPADIDRRARERPVRVAFVGNVAPRKGLDTLVTGLAAADIDAELTVVGRVVDPEHALTVRRRIREHGLGDRVHLRGELADDELGAVLGRSHLLAMPSRHEGFGIAYLEGMRFGLPALASRAGGASDLVTDGENGVLVDPDDPTAVARGLERIAADPDRLAEMGRAALARAEAHPAWPETVARVRDLLAAVARSEVAA